MRLALETAGQLNREHLFQVLAVHSLPSQERLDARNFALHRTLWINEQLREVHLRFEPRRVIAEFDQDVDLERARAVLEHWFGLAQDPTQAYRGLAESKYFAPLALAHVDLRLISYPSIFETIATAILGQQVSTKAAATLTARYLHALGARHDCGLIAFPTARATAQIAPAELQKIISCPRTRSDTLVRASQWYAGEGLELQKDPESFLKSFAALRGVGPWTRDYVALRGLRHSGIFLGSDLVVKRIMSQWKIPPEAADGIPESSRWLATIILWAQAHRSIEEAKQN